MLISRSTRELIEAEVRATPPMGGELRPLHGSDALYVSDADSEAEPNFTYVLTLLVDNRSYLVYRKLIAAII